MGSVARKFYYRTMLAQPGPGQTIVANGTYGRQAAPTQFFDTRHARPRVTRELALRLKLARGARFAMPPAARAVGLIPFSNRGTKVRFFDH